MDFPFLSLNPDFSAENGVSYLQKKLSMYHLLVGWGQKYDFSNKSSEEGPKNGSNRVKIITRKKRLIFSFSLQLLIEMDATFGILFALKHPEPCPKGPK